MGIHQGVMTSRNRVNPKRSGGGGTLCPTARRLPAISHRNHLEVSKLLTFPTIMLNQRQHSHFEHILNGCPEIGPSLPKTYKIFEANFRNVDFVQSFDNKNFQYQFKYKLLMFWGFFWGAACYSSSKINKSQIFAYDFPLFAIGQFGDLLGPN